MFRRRITPSRSLALAALFSVLAGLWIQGIAGAQGGRNLILNRIESRTWPDIVLNLSLVGPDGKAVPDINPNQFEIQERGTTQNLVGLELGPARSIPLALALVIDVSGSMNADNKLAQAKSSAAAFLNSLRPEDGATLLAFNQRVIPVTPFTNDRNALLFGVNALQASGNTAIYDALYSATDVLRSQPTTKRRAVILLTDGEDTSSKYASGAAAAVAKEAGVLVYTIGLGADVRADTLKSLAEPSGGKYYAAPSPADLTNIYNAISLELDSQFYLKYKSATRIARSYETVDVVVKYTSPDGQVLIRSITYRPPSEALIDSGAGNNTTKQPPVSGFVQKDNSADPEAAPAAAAPTVGTNMNVRLFSLSAALLASIAALFGFAGFAALMSPSPTSQRIAAYVTGSTDIEKPEQEPNFVARIIVPAVENLGERITRFSPKGYTEHISQLLTLTGPPYRLQLGGFLGIQLACTVMFVLIFGLWALATSADTPSQWILGGLLGVALGTYLPYFWLKRRVTNRRRALLRSLPGALDFLAINVEAGLGFDAALNQVVQRWHNALTDEFALMLIDFQIGKPRKDAWRDLVQRTQLPELTTFVTAMLQNEQIGSSIGTLLRTQADQMRVRRRQAAEEAARTAPVKMLLPMVFFIFPGLFVVVLGPAIPQFLTSLSVIGK